MSCLAGISLVLHTTYTDLQHLRQLL